MKKITKLIVALIFVFSLSGVCSAATLGNVTYSDIVAYINHFPIHSFHCNGSTLIAAEDLRDYGFDVKWNEYKRTLTITRDKSKTEPRMNLVYHYPKKLWGKKRFALTTTDVRVFTENYEYAAYGGLDGYTLINIEDLQCIDGVKVEWNQELRAVKMWVEDGLYMSYYMMSTFPDGVETYGYCGNVNENVEYNCFHDSVGGDFQIYIGVRGKKTGKYLNCDGDYLEITDVIDADGNSILKKKLGKRVYGYSATPYLMWETVYYSELSAVFEDMNLVDVNGKTIGVDDIYDERWPVMAHIELTSDDILPQTASEPGGLVKFKYYVCCEGVIISDSIKVDELPYQ